MHTCQTIQVYFKFNLLKFRRYIAASSELHTMNKHKLYLYIHDNYVLYTNGKNIKKKGLIIKELHKQYVKAKIESLDITGNRYIKIPGQIQY